MIVIDLCHKYRKCKILLVGGVSTKWLGQRRRQLSGGDDFEDMMYAALDDLDDFMGIHIKQKKPAIRIGYVRRNT